MSETNEIVEKPPSEIPVAMPSIEKLTDVSENGSKKDSDISMLEDEEMPTYSSISSSTKPNNSAANFNQRVNHVPVEKSRSQSPEPSDNQDNEDNESVYVVSSTPDTDRNFDDIDDEEDDYDSDEMNEDDDDEDDEDEDDREDYDRDRFEREFDDFDQDRFERASDDYVLRHNNSFKQYYKERSLSLQDLSTKDDPYNRRRSFPRLQYYMDQPLFKPNVYSPYVSNAKTFLEFERFKNMEKNKRFIQNAREQQRLSNMQNRSNIRDSKENNTKQSADGKQIKDYSENAVRKSEEGPEICENQPSTYATLERVENLESRETSNLPSKGTPTEIHTPMEIDLSESDRQDGEKYKKVNGIIEFDVESGITCTPIIKEQVTIRQTSEQMNGTESSNNVINLRTLSYKEYMGGTSQEEEDDVSVEGIGADNHDEDDDDDEDGDSGNNDDEDDDVDDEDVEVKIEATEICLISPEKIPHDAKQNYINTTDSIKITSVKSNYHDHKSDEISKYKDKNHIKMINQATETIRVENSEIKKLQNTLSERNTQFENLKIAYQKTLQESLAMKQELNHLNQALVKYEEYRNRETKSTSVQTERFENIDSQKVHLNEGKDGTSTSAVDSTHQWSESGSSPSISIAAPDVRKAINSDDSSVFEKTSKHPPHTLSRTFITSSRILQTLSNITQNRWNVSNPLTQEEKNQERQDEAKFPQDPSPSGTPLNSKKRKANEMLGAPGFEQPFKIPHTSGSARKKTSQDSNNETSQMNGLPPQSENCPENRKNGQGAENEEDDEQGTAKGDLGDNLKYYIYQDEENSKERSFLIQAEETGKIPNRGTVRECGPYLLGNLEVRMTEVNGTINIWGKEINMDSSEEEMDLSGKSAEAKSSLFWQKASQTNSLNNSSMMSSTSKKLNPQSRFNDSNVSKLSHLFDNSTPKYSLGSNNQSCHRRSSLTSDDNCTSRPHGLSWSGCKHLMGEQKHVCYSGHTNLDCGRYSCIHSVNKCECHSCNRVQGCAESYRRHSFSGDSNKFPVENQCLNHSCHCLKAENDHVFKHKSAHCQSSYDNGQNCHHFSRQCHLPKESTHSCNAKNVAMHSECRGNLPSDCCQSRNSNNENDNDHFLSAQQSLEQMEVQKKRLSGKKVRTLLMDLLKGCGDCRTPNPGNISQANIANRECKPEIIVTPCTPRASYSNQSQSMEKNRCCDTCYQRIQVTAEIEAQLEFFRIEMERVRSRSDALLDKLNMLKSTDND